MVDDCAIDGSSALIDKLAHGNDNVIALHLGRNSGQHPATMAGILRSSGDWVVTMDEDLQHSPEKFIDLLQHVSQKSLDVVYAHADNNVHRSKYRDLSSRLYKKFIGRLSSNPAIGNASSFRLIRGSVARSAARVCSGETYFDVALSWFTERIGFLPMQLTDHRYVLSGTSGYGFHSLMSHARRLLISSHMKVLRVASLLGIGMVFLSFIAALILVIYKIALPDAVQVAGWTSLMVTIGLIGGLLLFLSGISLEYMSFLVQQAHGRPNFFVINRVGDEELNRFFRNSKH